eukprot:1151672-Pelagomonas_calceolata.AAC.1
MGIGPNSCPMRLGLAAVVTPVRQDVGKREIMRQINALCGLYRARAHRNFLGCRCLREATFLWSGSGHAMPRVSSAKLCVKMRS